ITWEHRLVYQRVVVHWVILTDLQIILDECVKLCIPIVEAKKQFWIVLKNVLKRLYLMVRGSQRLLHDSISSFLQSRQRKRRVVMMESRHKAHVKILVVSKHRSCIQARRMQADASDLHGVDFVYLPQIDIIP